MTEFKLQFLKLKPEHLLKVLEVQKDTRGLPVFSSPEFKDVLEKIPHAYACVYDNEPIACMGLRDYWPGRAEGWAMFTPEAAKHMLEITKVVREFLKQVPVKRIEAAVEMDFKKGHKWAKLLGFTEEASGLKSFFMNGKDATLYARVN